MGLQLERTTFHTWSLMMLEQSDTQTQISKSMLLLCLTSRLEKLLTLSNLILVIQLWLLEVVTQDVLELSRIENDMLARTILSTLKMLLVILSLPVYQISLSSAKVTKLWGHYPKEK